MDAVPTILLVEDDSNDVVLLERAFRKAEVSDCFQIVPDGEAAMHYLAGIGEYADRTRYPMPRLVILDVRLPRKSGFEFLQWLRQQPELKSLPVVMLGASRETRDIVRAYELGANSYLAKPGSPEELIRLVRAFKHYWFEWNLPAEMAR